MLLVDQSNAELHNAVQTEHVIQFPVLTVKTLIARMQ